MKEIGTLAIFATLAVFGSKALHELAGGKNDVVGLAVQVAGGMGGIWLAKKLA